MIGRLRFENEQEKLEGDWYISSPSGKWPLHDGDVSVLNLEKNTEKDWWDGRFVDFEVVIGCKPSMCNCPENASAKYGKTCLNSMRLGKIIDSQPDLNSIPVSTCIENWTKLENKKWV